MPRITTVVATERPGVLQLPRNVPVATAEDLGAIAFREVERFGGALGTLAQTLQDQDNDLELAELKGRYDAGVMDIALEVEKAPDFFERPALFARDSRQMASELAESASNNAVRSAFTAHVIRRLPVQIVEVKTDALRAMHADLAVRLEDHLEILKRKIAEQTSEEAQEELIAFGVDLVKRAQARNVVTPEGGRVLRTRFLQDTVEVRIRQQLRLDPFLAEENLLSGDIDIDPLKKEALLRTATVRQRELLRLDREAEREADRKFREERRLAVGELTARARRGELSLDQIEEERRTLGLGAQEVNMLEEIVENAPQGRSDPEILDDVIRRLNLIPAQITRPELFRLRQQQREGGRGLNREDFLKLLDRFDKNVAAARSPARSDILFRHRQGEDQINMSLRSQNIIDVWKAPAAQTLAVAMMEYRDRSLALNPQGEDPYFAAKAVIRKYLPLLEQSANAAIAAKRHALPFQTKQALLNAKIDIGDELYYFYANELRELEKAEVLLRAVQEEIARTQKAGRIADEPKPIAPQKDREPPPPGLEPRPTTERPAPTLPEGREPPSPARPSPLVPEAPQPGQRTIQRRFRGRPFLTR